MADYKTTSGSTTALARGDTASRAPSDKTHEHLEYPAREIDAVARAAGASPEYVAYLLFRHIAAIHQRPLHREGSPEDGRPATKEWIFETYEECLNVVRGSNSHRRSTL